MRVRHIALMLFTEVFFQVVLEKPSSPFIADLALFSYYQCVSSDLLVSYYYKRRILERLLVPTNFLVYHSRLARFKFKLVYTLQQREILPFDFFFLFFSFQTIRYVLFRYSFKCFFGVINRIMVMQ